MIECIYCGNNRESSREHVVQDALGGVDVLTTVCQPCNRKLSSIDKVLADHSPLSLIARQELACNGPISWDVDETQNGLLLEARVTHGSPSMTVCPQVVFDGNERLFYDDADDLAKVGTTVAENLFYSHLRRAFDQYRIYGPNARKKDHKHKDALKLKQIEKVRSGYRLPPRICCREPVSEYRECVTFELRYHTEADRNKVLNALSTLDWDARARIHTVKRGSTRPEVHLEYSVTDTIRAISKIGFNLLAFFSKSTGPSLHSFPRAVEWILDSKHVEEFGDINESGFVDPLGIAPLECPSHSHKFRLTHDCSTNTWKFYAAFFGGRAGARVSFPGPNQEVWATMDVVAPYDKPMLAPIFHDWYRALDTEIVLGMAKILPSVGWTNDVMHLRKELAPQ